MTEKQHETAEPPDLAVPEKALVDTIALTPSTGLVIDPYPGGGGEAPESFVGGIFQAGPLAVGGLIANVLSIVATVAVARLLTTSQYGGIVQLLGLFFVLSMPGSALMVGVVRRVTGMTAVGDGATARVWATRLYRRAVLGVALWSVFSLAVEAPLSHALRLPDDGGVAFTMIAAGFWLLLCIDRAILQSHRRYAGLGLSLIVEIGVRTVLVLTFAELGFGIWGYALGLAIGEVVAAAQAHVAARRAWDPESAAPPLETAGRAPALSVDLTAALVGFALLGVLQNADIILVGRLHPSNSGSYAAISVAAKALVFGAILLGSYILPEASIRWHRGEHALRQLGVTLVFFLVPTVLLLTVALAVPRQFLTIFFGARLAGGAPSFAALVGAMACLGITVVLTNYLLGSARRWVVAFLGIGVVCLLILIHRAHGGIAATTRAELLVQGGLLLTVLVAFVVVHVRARPRSGRAPVGRVEEGTAKGGL
ncbi:MAG: lipopolysaccharide biosynthesis protein [Acidimicrobiales bacterium]